MMMQRARRFSTWKEKSALSCGILALPYEIRVLIYLEALRPIPTRIHFPHNQIKLWSLVPSFNPGDLIASSPLFLLCKQIYTETAALFYRHTSLVFRLKELEQPLHRLMHWFPDVASLNKLEQPINQVLNRLPEVASRNLQTVELHAGAFYLDTGKTEEVVSLIQAKFPNLQDIHVTLEQRRAPSYKSEDVFAITPRRLLDLTGVSSRLSRMRIFIAGAFQQPQWSIAGFQTILEDLSKFLRLEEVEIYFETKEEGGFIDYSGTSEPSTAMIAYLASERAILGPYLSGLAAALPQVKGFEIWRLRPRGFDNQTGTQPVQEGELLELLGGRARHIDSQAGHPLVERCPDGHALAELAWKLKSRGYGL